MIHGKQLFLAAVAVWVMLAPLGAAVAAAAAKTATVTFWTRKKGSYGDDQNPVRLRERAVDWAKVKLRRQSMFDLQYGRKMDYRGLPLKDLLSVYDRRPGDDLALLHFDNGMVVPVVLDDSTVLAKLNAFLALGVCKSKVECSSDFEPVGKDDAYSVTNDPRPITFNGNKIVVASAWHPEIAAAANASGFSPWRYADSLRGIELVNAAAYYHQFDVGEAAGLAVFRHRCQFCHGVRYMGASFGWDFVKPLPLYERRPPDQLLNHVKYPKTQAKERGLMMPPQADVEPAEINSLWRWMRSAALRQAMPAYLP